ncbi:hypothetical protein CLOM_g15019 [Closterium sp. NIES-68]|nr:hypothetical protein CLOM_g21685 [Closterium sp. NIES-68]GJP39873.1 hypothetical protein CLOM_g24204 [Closterium sp. NIES-68]GJP47509.1 hypothetical protein CLOM_g6694 [Closterium sp. NIES-68]GJP55982.1 hypothetical protein CLOM_g15019 [Closterium sp. NIES-68]GJP60022.1 hypothetical protein CLOP_g17166 [Closterium sp. NIES-67]
MMTSAVTDGEPRQADVDEFRECLSRASRVAVLTGAGVSAASGVATFRGAGGLWRTYDAMVRGVAVLAECGARGAGAAGASVQGRGEGVHAHHTERGWAARSSRQQRAGRAARLPLAHTLPRLRGCR